MKIGLHISDFTFSKGPSGLAEDLTRVVAGAEDACFPGGVGGDGGGEGAAVDDVVATRSRNVGTDSTSYWML